MRSDSFSDSVLEEHSVYNRRLFDPWLSVVVPKLMKRLNWPGTSIATLHVIGCAVAEELLVELDIEGLRT